MSDEMRRKDYAMWKPGIVVFALAGLVWEAPQASAQADDPRLDPAARPTLGISVAPAPRVAGRAGVVVESVLANGPADRAGVRPGDLLVKLDTQEVRDYESLLGALAKHKAGDKVALQLLRQGAEKSVTVTLEGVSQRQTVRRFPFPAPAAFLGVQAQPLTPELKEQLGVTAKAGAAIMEVVPDTPAAKAGLRRGDVITQLDGKAISGPEDLQNAIREAGPDKEITLTAARGKEEKQVKTQLQAATPAAFVPPVMEEAGTVQALQRRVEELEKRVRDLEQKLKQKSPE
jgi:S1-C subfamily serine protease